MTNFKRCPICKKKVVGRSDKRFCSLDCKNNYHIRLQKHTSNATEETDKILHRNRSILLELMGRSKTRKKISRIILDKKNFSFDYITGFHINTKNKTIHHVYDFSWAIFTDQEVLIMRNVEKDSNNP
jgi:endogenous inhibitor of DNA gyrase (YacG/DUF329 family)